ncbi:MAG: SUMF1/EgtB/PvdO family nonheme iron enzyme [Myxococcales bacterium]|nr:SUMF1/EgtB/PvdO family nonheme iron enzyme [Myxococcales bacterium]
MQKGRAHQEVLTGGPRPVRVWFLLGLIGCGDGAGGRTSSSAVVSVELPSASAVALAPSASVSSKPLPPPRPPLPNPDLYPQKLDEQREAMFGRMKVMLALGDGEITAVKAIFEKSPVLGQGNPEITEYAMTRAECMKVRAEANVVDEDDPICGAPFMVPLWDPKAGETRADAKVCIDRYEFPNIPCEYPVTWVQGVEAAKLCKAVGKRICDTHEWEGGCAGALHAPDVEYKFGKPRKEMKFSHNADREIVWAYGAQKDHTKCGTASHKNKTCKESGWKKCGSNSYPAGSFPACKSSFGVYDQHGNVAEHMNMPLNAKQLASAGGAGETEMKGSWFIFQKFEAHDDDCRWRAPDWHAAKLMSPDSHLNYHLGFRCCKDVGPAPAK